MPWNASTFENMNCIIHQKMHQLQNLSIFLQGPLRMHFAYQSILQTLLRTQHVISPKFMVARIPRPAVEETVQRLGFDQLGLIDELWEWKIKVIQIYQPQLQPGQNAHNIADLDTGEDSGWRVGTIFLPSNDKANGLTTRNYAFFTPPDQDM